MQRRTREDDKFMEISKRMTYILRHGAAKCHLALRPDGYALSTDLLKCGRFPPHVNEEIILEIVKNDKKGRFGTMRDETGRLWIRANQGHTISTVDREELLMKIEDAALYPCCIHGTSLAAWRGIKNTGLCRMKRNEIHCAKGEYGDVLSGFRRTCEVLIYIDLALCLEKGVPFYESANGVLLTPGLGPKGVLPSGFFKKAILIKTDEELDFTPSFELLD